MTGKKNKETTNVKEMVRKVSVSGYEEFKKKIDELYVGKKTQVNILFTGEKNAQGKSWCPDCNDDKLSVRLVELYKIMIGKKTKDTAHVKEVVRKICVSGYEEFLKTIKELYVGAKPQVNVLFLGEKNAQGLSWCPNCRYAEPFIQKAVAEYARKDSIFLEVDVGNREVYKDLENPFRLDKETKIQEIPTLLRWKTVFRLEGSYCATPGVLEMFFTEPDEED